MGKIISMALVFTLVIGLVPFVFAQRDDDGPLRNIANDRDIRRANQQLLEIPKAINDLRSVNKLREKSLMMKDEVLEIKERLRQCSDNTEGDCVELRKEVKLRVKGSLQKVTERLLNVLNSLKERVSGSDIENKDAVLNEVTSAIENIEAAQDKVESLNEQSTKEEIKSAIGELKNALKEAQRLVREYYSKAHITKQRLENAINKYNKLAENIGDRLDRFEERGYDFSELKAKLDGLKSKISDAENALSEDKLRDSLGFLKEAHSITLDILKTFRANLDGTDEEESDGDSDEDESDDEDDSDEDEEGSDDEGSDDEGSDDEVECESDEDCEESEVCIENECEDEEETECAEDSDCEEGMICDDGECEETGGDDDE